MSPKKRLPITILIPVYNEADSLHELTDGLKAGLAGKKAEIIFVNDGSTDGSTEILDSLEPTKDIQIHVIHFRRNSGKSMALAAGVDAAQGEMIITLDADLQNDPSDLPLFIKGIEDGADMVIGWRINRDDPLEKKLPSRFFNWITSRSSGLHIHDFNCGFKAHRREVLEELPLYGDMHRFVPVLAHKRGFDVQEVQVTHHPRKHGYSKYGFERYLRGALDLLTVLFLTSYIVRPMHLFGGIGITTSAFGVLSFLYLFFGRWIWGVSIGSSPLLMVSCFAIGIGVQIVIFGFLAEMIVHWQRTANPPLPPIRQVKSKPLQVKKQEADTPA